MDNIPFDEDALRELAEYATAQGVEVGINVTLCAVEDALMQAEFVEWPIFIERVRKNIVDRLKDTPYAVGED